MYILSKGISGRKSYSALWVLCCTAFMQQRCLWPAWHLFVWSSEPKASSVFTLHWHVWLKLVNSNYPTLAEHDCWINKNTSCWADEPWMLIWCLEVLQSPIPWQQPVEINCTWVGINSSLFLCRGIDGFWSQHAWCTVEGFSAYCVVLGSIFLEALWKERKTAVMNLNGGKKASEIWQISLNTFDCQAVNLWLSKLPSV